MKKNFISILILGCTYLYREEIIISFDIKLYAEKVSCLIENVEERMFITKKAYEKSQEFHLDEIGYRWMVLFSSLF